MDKEIERRLRETMDGIISSMKMIKEGKLARCEDCGEVHPTPEGLCPLCGGETEKMDFVDEFDDAFDFKVISGLNKEYRHIRIEARYGGPNIWIDTEDSIIEGFWEGRLEIGIPRELSDAIDEDFERYWKGEY